jgi:hypothetical protein
MAEETTEDGFIRHWSERAYDQAQLASIITIQENLVDYAMNGWRSMGIVPEANMPLICACDEGLVLMSVNQMGEWRTNEGKPHKPPRAWMPAPTLPKVNGRSRI